ncbi:hypothetical protein Taro_026301 [Colocasia esculenta]|uniref:Uncharacterized protein n=1 Tax=Colocasia esculenta TaxID=4460 RepID=A0A843VK76_COLES|nr:hypothetical protein [Colocasia esculenta]
MIRARVAGCSFCCAACVASVVARRVRAVAARLALDSLAVVFLVWRTLASQSSLVGCPLVVGVCVVIVVFGLVFLCAVVCCARDAELSRCLACCVAPLVERCDTCLWLLSAWRWLVVNSSKVLLEFFSIGSGGNEDRFALVSAVAVLPQSLRYAASVGLAGAFWRVFPERCLGGSGGGWLLALLVESAWALSVKALCAWLCVWLLRWPACLVSHSGLMSAVGVWLAVLLVEASILRCGLPLARGRDSLRCVSPSSVFRWLLEVVMFHCGVLPGCASLGPSEVDVLSSTSAVVLLLVWLCVALVSLEADGGVFCQLGPSEVDVLSSTSAVVLLLVWLCVALAGCRLLVLKATHLWSRSGCSGFCSASRCSDFSCRAVCACVGRRPLRGFRKGVLCVPVPAGLVLVTSRLCRFCGDCPACSLFARCLALEGLPRSEVVSVAWDPRPREPVEGVLRATSVLEALLSGSGTSRCLEFLAQTRQSFVSLSLSALVPEPRSGVRREAAAWPGCGVACVVCFCGGSVSPFAGAEAGARLASRACGLRVPLLAASGGGLVAVITRASRFGVLSVPWFRGPIPGCQPVMAPACVAPRPDGVSTVPGGSACVLSTASTLCLTLLVSAGVVCVARPRLVVVALRFLAALASEGLVIPTGPCSRGSPPYFLQLGARRRGSSMSDGLRRRLWRRIVVSSSESERWELL